MPRVSANIFMQIFVDIESFPFDIYLCFIAIHIIEETVVEKG